MVSCSKFFSSICNCMASSCACCAQTCFCLTACTGCCKSRDGTKGSIRRDSYTPREPLKIATKTELQDIMKTLVLARDYRSKAEIEQALAEGEHGFSRPVQLLKSLSDDRTSVAVFSFPNSIVIAFHMDHDTDDFLSAVSCDPVRLERSVGVPGCVHDGIVQAWSPISEQVLQQVQLFVRDNPSGLISMAGFGVGGAIASLNAIYTQSQLFLSDRLHLMTFGSVRCVNRKMRRAAATLLNGNAFDIVIGSDPVVSSKRYTTLGTKYYRIGQIIHLRKDHRAYDQDWTRWERMRAKQESTEHDLDRYRIEVEAWDGNVLRIAKQ